jgi:hypothetical protein
MDLMEQEHLGIQRQNFRNRRCWSMGTEVRKKVQLVPRIRALKEASKVVLRGLLVSNIGALKVVCKRVAQVLRIEV